MFHWLKKKNKELRLILTEKEACEKQLVPGLTAIIPTSASPPDVFAMSFLSLLANSTRESLTHVIVTINGADPRTGSTFVQDVKQKFLEIIRTEKWEDGDMPLTIQRVWSRVGHAQSVDSAMAWVHTQNFLLMHDDVLVLEPNWGEIAKPYLDNRKIGLAYVKEAERNLGFLLFEKRRGKWTMPDETPPEETSLSFPHPHTYFLVGRKSDLLKFKWEGYFCPGPWTVEWDQRVKELSQPGEKFLTLQSCDYITYEIGSWLMHNLKNEGYEIAELPEKIALHLGSFTLSNGRFQLMKRKTKQEIFVEVENKIQEKVPRLYEIYKKMFKNNLWTN